MRKNKRLLSVHPLDFDPDDYFPHSRRQSVQVWQQSTYANIFSIQVKVRTNRPGNARSIQVTQFVSGTTAVWQVNIEVHWHTVCPVKDGAELHLNLRNVSRVSDSMIVAAVSCDRWWRIEVTGMKWTTRCTTTEWTAGRVWIATPWDLIHVHNTHKYTVIKHRDQKHANNVAPVSI